MTVEEIVERVSRELPVFGAGWVTSNFESILTNMKAGESSIIEFPNQLKKLPEEPKYDLLKNVPIRFEPKRLYLGVQGRSKVTRSAEFGVQRRPLR